MFIEIQGMRINVARIMCYWQEHQTITVCMEYPRSESGGVLDGAYVFKYQTVAEAKEACARIDSKLNVT